MVIFYYSHNQQGIVKTPIDIPSHSAIIHTGEVEVKRPAVFWILIIFLATLISLFIYQGRTYSPWFWRGYTELIAVLTIGLLIGLIIWVDYEYCKKRDELEDKRNQETIIKALKAKKVSDYDIDNVVYHYNRFRRDGMSPTKALRSLYLDTIEQWSHLGYKH